MRDVQFFLNQFPSEQCEGYVDCVNIGKQFNLPKSVQLVKNRSDEYYLLDVAGTRTKVSKLSTEYYEHNLLWFESATNRGLRYLFDVASDTINLQNSPPEIDDADDEEEDKPWESINHEEVRDAVRNVRAQYPTSDTGDVDFKGSSDDEDDETTMVKIFYELCDDIDDQPFPGQELFAQETFKRFREAGIATEAYRDQWLARFRRTWLSLVRESHFQSYINDEYDDDYDNVVYDIEEDTQKGSDITIQHDGNEYHINLFTYKNRESLEWIVEKKENRKDEKDAVDIFVPLYVFEDDAPKDVELTLNNFDLYLYNDEHASVIRDMIAGDGPPVVRKNGKVVAIRGYDVFKAVYRIDD